MYKLIGSILLTSTFIYGWDDIARLPPETEEFYSQNKKLKFVCHSSNKIGGSYGRLFSKERNGWKAVWQSTLPNLVRPRFIIVTNTKSVVTFDDWDNVASQHAIVIYDPEGNLSSDTSLEELVPFFKTDIESVAKSTSRTPYGWWLQKPPKANSKGLIALRVINKDFVFNPVLGTIKPKR